MSYKFIDLLKKFNRKERFYLIGMALGKKDFSLSEKFILELQKAFPNNGIDFSNPLFSAMDYHIDWIYASLFLSSKSPNVKKYIGDIALYSRDIDKQLITGTQQDIDFISVFSDKTNPERSHLIMLEAKGATGWTNDQLQSKAQRLRAIFNNDGKKYHDIVQPHFAILSPKKPSKKLKTTEYPEFMTPNNQLVWIKRECSEFCVTVSVPGSASAPAEVKVRSENGPSISHVGGVDFCWSGVPGTIFSICK
ncbi:MAG: hypothetical protein HUK40_03250 [Desulfobacter sp.]|nr:hypothetical protein [Desulfobacter sp.]